MTSPPGKCRQCAQHPRARHWINRLDEKCGDTGAFAPDVRVSSRRPRTLVARNIAQFPVLVLFIFLPIDQMCATVPCANIRPPSEPFPPRPGNSPRSSSPAKDFHSYFAFLLGRCKILIGNQLRIEFAATHSKQTEVANSNREKTRGCLRSAGANLLCSKISPSSAFLRRPALAISRFLR